jgi:hypothetical protein
MKSNASLHRYFIHHNGGDSICRRYSASGHLTVALKNTPGTDEDRQSRRRNIYSLDFLDRIFSTAFS